MESPVVFIIVALNVLTSLVAFERGEIFNKLFFSPMQVLQGEWHRLIGHAFIHTSYLHLIVNMFVFYMFGRRVELFFYDEFGRPGGTLLFLLLYFGGLIVASLPSLVKHAKNPAYRAVGASGAVAAVLFAHILVHPANSLIVFPIPFPLPAFLFGILYVVYEHYMSKKEMDHIAHDAHLWGAIYGFAFTALCAPPLLKGFFITVVDYFSSWG